MTTSEEAVGWDGFRRLGVFFFSETVGRKLRSVSSVTPEAALSGTKGAERGFCSPRVCGSVPSNERSRYMTSGLCSWETCLHPQVATSPTQVAPPALAPAAASWINSQQQPKDILWSHRNGIACQMMKYLELYQPKVVFPAASGSARHFNSTKLIF